MRSAKSDNGVVPACLREMLACMNPVDHQIEIDSLWRLVPVFDVDEMPLGTADFGYPLARVIGEFDGHTPFGRLRSGEFPFDVPAQEKTAEQEREHRLRLAGWRVVRWTWADLAAPNELLARLTAALSARC